MLELLAKTNFGVSKNVSQSITYVVVRPSPDGKRKTIAVYNGEVGEARRLATVAEGAMSG